MMKKNHGVDRKRKKKNNGVGSSGEGGGDIVSDPSPFDSLPEGCISSIISFTSPRDACVAAVVSKTFESAVKSDIVWEKFLPPEYASLFPQSRVFSSKKELYFALCDDPVLIEDGQKSFWLEKASGKRCVMLSAMSMSIIWGDDPRYWRWIPDPEARFEKAAELLNVCWFEIRGRTNTRVLSPRTRYSAYIVFIEGDDDDEWYGFGDVAIEAKVGVVGQRASKRFICFDATTDGSRRRRKRKLVKPEEREDGWMEVELGRFFNEGGLMNSDEIEMSALETKNLNWKRGLTIRGIEIRPARIREEMMRGEGGGDRVSDHFDSLPEGCISSIISFTSPLDACVAASVSKTFESAVKSDVVWEKFLPPGYASLVPRSRVFSSKKELYFTLCNVLFDGGRKSFGLDKASGKSCVMLSAMNISITWGDNPEFWQWIPNPESRFERVAELLQVCWFEIRGRTNTRVLSPRTRYSAYIVFKRLDDCYGFENVAIEAEVGVVGHEASRRYICFGTTTDGQVEKAEEREDGWMEVELGEFYNEGGLMNGDEVVMSALETRQLHWKRGLIIQGIEIRPAKIQLSDAETTG